MLNRAKLITLSLVATAFATAGCTQESTAQDGSAGDSAPAASSASAASAGGVTDASVSAEASSEKPPPFDTGEVRIAVVRQLNTGDVYQAWIEGVQKQADALGVELDIYNANGDDAKQALYLDQAIASKPDGILVGWGFADSLRSGLKSAQEAGIPVATYYVETDPTDNLLTIDQGDDVMMEAILDQLVEDIGEDAQVIYVYVAGYQALDLRNEVWEKFSDEHPGIQNVATIGVVNSNTAAQVADQAKAALTANPDVTAIVAPYDEFAKGATLAVQELGLEDKVKVYGMDISTADIQVMKAANSPWVITATTDQSNVGATAMRAISLKVAGQLEGNHLTVPPLVVHQDELLDQEVKNIEDLAEAFPDLMTPDLLNAPWMG